MPKKLGSKEKLRRYFLAHVGKVLDSDTLKKEAGVSEWARRVRELRDEEGMHIVTHNDRSDLKPWQYVLVDKKLRPAFERGISKETRAIVLDRNGYTCLMCGAGAGEIHPFDGRKVRLHIGHIVDKSQGGSDDPSNLRAVCSLCNEGASNITVNRPDSVKLLMQIRRAPGSEQLKVLQWLIAKYPKQSKDITGKLE